MHLVGWFGALGTLVVLCGALPGRIHVGGLFDYEDWEVEAAFKIAVDWLNADNRILNHSKVIASVDTILLNDDNFGITKRACGLLQNGVTAIFGPQSEQSSMHVQSICDDLEVPHIKTRWEYQLRRDQLSVNVFPHPSVLSKAYLQIIEVWNWRNFSLVYEEDEAVVRMKDFFIEGEKRNWRITLHKLEKNLTSSYRDTFWEVKKLGKRGNISEHNIVLDVPRKHLFEVLKSAQQVGMMTENQKYLITSLDLHTIDLSHFQYGKTNVTGLKLVQEETKEFLHLLNEVNKRVQQAPDPPPLLTTLKTETTLVFDAVRLFAMSLELMDQAKQIEAFPPVSCNLMNKGIDGTSLVNIIKSSKMDGGLSGVLEFDGEGFRSDASFDIMYLTDHGLTNIGTIQSTGEMSMASPPTKSDFEFIGLKNSHFKVTTVINPPYTMLRESSNQMTGNDRFEGYTVDLMDSLKELLGFTYEMHVVADGSYGSVIDNTDGAWNGMIGEVVNGTADLAIADLTITTTRLKGVDFTLPFMQTGISILFRKPTEKVTSLFSFLLPFSGEVWLLIVICYVYISLLLFLVGRMSPYEWSNPYPCREEGDQVEGNCFSLLNCMWWSIGSLLQQGSDVSPSAPATRALTCTFSFFRVIIISSYTANLAAFLTVEKLVSPIESAQDLAKQEKIKYGCVRGGSTSNFFKNSHLLMYQRMHQFMERHAAEVYVQNNDDGVKKVNDGGYAFLMEATTIEYRTERECNLTRVGDLLDSKGYGIAVKKGRQNLRNWLSGGILFLQEEGKLHKFREKWWKQKKGGGKCLASKTSGSVNELGLGNVGGVILVMNLGLMLSAIVAIVEFFWFQRKLRRVTKESLCSLFLEEVKYAITCGSSSKSAPKIKGKDDTADDESGYRPFS